MNRIVDLFCGAGGTSTGFALACQAEGIPYELTVVNHWNVADLGIRKLVLPKSSRRRTCAKSIVLGGVESKSTKLKPDHTDTIAGLISLFVTPWGLQWITAEAFAYRQSYWFWFVAFYCWIQIARQLRGRK